MDYSKLSDDELLKLYNKPKASINFSSMSDEELLDMYKGSAQPKEVNTTSITDSSQNNPSAAHTPVIPKNGVIEGGIVNEPDYAKPQNSFLANIDEKIKLQAQQNLEKRARWEEAHPIISDLQKSMQPFYSANALDWEKKAKYGAVTPVKEELKNTAQKVRSNIAPSANLALLPVGGEYTAIKGAQALNAVSKIKPVAQFITTHPNISKWAATAPLAITEGAGWGVADKALRELSGIESNDSLGEAALGGAATMGLLHGGVHTLGSVANSLKKTAPIEAITKGYNNLLNSDTTIGNTLANIQGTISDTMGLDAVNETARKYQALNRNISKGNTPITKKFSKTDLDEIANAENLTKEQQDLIFDRLKNGEPNKSTITKEQEDAKEFFDNILEQEKKTSEHAQGGLSHVKSESDINTPKLEGTAVKNDSDMSEDRFKINLPEEKVDDNNFFKQQQEKWKKQREAMKAQEAVQTVEPVVENNTPQIKRSAYGGRVHVEKDGKPWIAYSKKRKLPSGNAEGSDSGNWYTQEATSKPKALNAEDIHESSIDDIKSISDNDLMKEIDEARKGKQLPSVNQPTVIKSKTPAQRMADKLHNERAKRAWSQKLKTKVKALNSDAEADAKTLGEIIFGTSNKKNTLSDYSNSLPKNHAKYTGAIVTGKVKEFIQKEPLPRWIEKYFGDIDVHIADIKHNDKEQGFYDYKTNSITIYSDAENYGKTLVHEIRHAVQKQLALKTWAGSHARKLIESCKKRNKELQFYTKSNEKMAVINRVEPFVNKLKNKVISEKEFINNVPIEEARLYQEYVKALKRYKSAYLERDARDFANGNYERKLFKQSPNEFKSKLRKVKSKYPRTYENRRNARGFGDVNGESEIRIIEDFDGGGRPRMDESRVDRAKYSESIQQLSQPGETRLAPTPQSFIQSIRNSSKHQEQVKIDFDIITEEQAANRLKQQSASGDGTYIKQGFGKQDGKIDLVKDYNEGRSNKVGHFGEKLREGLKQKGSTKEILVETKKEEIRVQHMKDSINFIESEFAKPIPESGEITKGYVAVNRNLLANAIYGNKSTAWYEMMAKGEDAIKKSYKNEKVAQNWIDLAQRNSKADFQIPEQVFNKLFDGSGETVAEYWQRYGKDHTGKAMLKTAGAILDAFNNSFKRGVLTSSSFVFNNRFGNQMMIAAKSNPIEYIKSFYTATKLKNKDLPVEIIESSLLEAVEGYQARQTYTGWQPLDNFLNLCGGHTIDTSTLKTIKVAPDNGLNFKVIKGRTVPKKTVESYNAKSIAAEAANLCIGLPNKAFNSLCDKLMKFNEAMERFERKQVYGIQINRVKKGLIKQTGQSMLSQEEFLKHIKDHPELEETIIKSIEDTLGDYNNFNKFEKKVLKRVVPFYSWYRTISRHTLTLAKENPARCAMIFLELERLKDKDQDLKEWQRGAIRTGAYDSRSNKELLINKTAQIPYSTFKEFVDESGKGGLSPAVKKPLEAIRGEQFFNNSEITSRRYKKVTKGYGKKAKEGYLDKETGKFKKGSLPLMPRLNYLGKEVLETAYPAMRSPLLKPEATIQGLGNLVSHGEYKEPDKLYDSDFGGYNKGDRFLGKEKRYAASDTSTSTKMLNRILGLSLQNKQPLNKEEREAYKEKIRQQRKRMQGK